MLNEKGLKQWAKDAPLQYFGNDRMVSAFWNENHGEKSPRLIRKFIMAIKAFFRVLKTGETNG